jgi:hypothetical protein
MRLQRILKAELLQGERIVQFPGTKNENHCLTILPDQICGPAFIFKGRI